MAKRNGVYKRTGASTIHCKSRLKNQCGFTGNESQAKKFIGICRRVAGKNGSIIISAKALGISRDEMMGIRDGEYSIAFVKGRAPTILRVVILK